MYCSLLLWDRCVRLEDECRHRGYDRSLVLGLIPCHAEGNLNACSFCAIYSSKCLMKLCQARDEDVSLVSAAVLNLHRPVRGWFTLPGFTQEKTTSLSSFCMCMIFCHTSSIISAAALLASSADFLTEIYRNWHVVSVLKNLGVQWPL